MTFTDLLDAYLEAKDHLGEDLSGDQRAWAEPEFEQARDDLNEFIASLRPAVIASDENQRCQSVLRAQGVPYPRTCSMCGLGPCTYMTTQVAHPIKENV